MTEGTSQKRCEIRIKKDKDFLGSDQIGFEFFSKKQIWVKFC